LPFWLYWERYPDESPFMAIKHCDDAGVL
jgi:hypothetical protein